MLTCVDHLVVAVDDLDQATETYRKLLGLVPSWRGLHAGMGTANTLFRVANTYLELLAPQGDGPVGQLVAQRPTDSGEGPLALALGTSDAQGCALVLRNRGIPVEDPHEDEGFEVTTGARRRWRSLLLPPADTRGVPVLVIEHLSPPDTLPLSTPSQEPESAVSAVDHVVIMTGSAEASVALYRDTLGLRLTLDRTFEKRQLRLLFFRLGGITIECAVPLAGSASSSGPDTFWGISYRVPNVAAARDRVARTGFDVSEVRDGLKPGTRVCTVRSRTHGVATLFLGPASN